MVTDPALERVQLVTIVREWGRIAVIGFGGPPAHIALLRKLCVEDRGWLSPREFEDGIAATNILPGPASTQLAIFCAWRRRGRLGALIGGVSFMPGLIVPLGLALAHLWQLGVLGLPAIWLLALRRGVVLAILGAGVLGVIAVMAGAPA